MNVAHHSRDALERAAEVVTAERRRQVEAEGWSRDHDDEHVDGEMMQAGMTYLWWGTEKEVPLVEVVVRPALSVAGVVPEPTICQVPVGWPWDALWWKPKDRMSNLVRAGALFMAEKDRLVRAGRPAGHVDDQIDHVYAEIAAFKSH